MKVNYKNLRSFRIDNAENERELRELKKVLDDIKGRMKKLDQASIDRFSDILKVSSLFLPRGMLNFCIYEEVFQSNRFYTMFEHCS